MRPQWHVSSSKPCQSKHERRQTLTPERVVSRDDNIGGRLTGLPAGLAVSTMARLLAAVESAVQLVAADHQALVLHILDGGREGGAAGAQTGSGSVKGLDAQIPFRFNDYDIAVSH